MELQKIINIFEEHGFNENNCSFFKQEDITDIAKDVLKAINYTHCSAQLNDSFLKGDKVIYCSVIYAEVVEDFKNGLVRIKEEYGEILNVKAIELEKQSI
tara:strand:- start:405 stop:704 length:300 start_codon:yes stop_codon:yes gene_type:complete